MIVVDLGYDVLVGVVRAEEVGFQIFFVGLFAVFAPILRKGKDVGISRHFCMGEKKAIRRIPVICEILYRNSLIKTRKFRFNCFLSVVCE